MPATIPKVHHKICIHKDGKKRWGGGGAPLGQSIKYGAPLAGARRVGLVRIGLISLINLLKETETGLAYSAGPAPAKGARRGSRSAGS